MQVNGLGLALVLSGMLAGCSSGTVQSDEKLADLIRSESPASRDAETRGDWSRVLEPRAFRFPADHAAHEDYRIEWWYFTGNLAAENGRRFGYQLTFFRTGLHRVPNNPSAWAVRDLYTAHFAISDFQHERHWHAQRVNRRGIGMAGASADPSCVWNGDWKFALDGDHFQLTATDGNHQIDLRLVATKAPVLHGDNGLSRKGAAPGNASYYYSLTRLVTEGRIAWDGQTMEVTGTSWMDHEFSSSFLEPGQSGWDWFSIQFEDESELMLYRIRSTDGSTDLFSSGTWVASDGSVHRLAADDFKLHGSAKWISAETGGEYPLKWLVEIPSLGVSLEVNATFAEQEMITTASTGISYWEGGIVVRGEARQHDLRGLGYMELTGYVGEELGERFPREW